MSVPVVRFTYRHGSPAAATTPRATKPWTLVYDGDCAVCTRIVRVIDRWDRRGEIETVPFQNADVTARFPWIPPEEYTEAMQLVGPGGRTWAGAEAVEQLLAILPRGRLIAWIFRVPFVGRLADRCYRWFARNRYRFGCGEHCAIQPPSPRSTR